MKRDGSVKVRLDLPGSFEPRRTVELRPGSALSVGIDPPAATLPPALAAALRHLRPLELRLGYPRDGGLSRLQLVIACEPDGRAWLAACGRNDVRVQLHGRPVSALPLSREPTALAFLLTLWLPAVSQGGAHPRLGLHYPRAYQSRAQLGGAAADAGTGVVHLPKPLADTQLLALVERFSEFFEWPAEREFPMPAALRDHRLDGRLMRVRERVASRHPGVRTGPELLGALLADRYVLFEDLLTVPHPLSERLLPLNPLLSC